MKKIKKLSETRQAWWFFCHEDQLWLLSDNSFPMASLEALGYDFDRQCPSYLLDYYQGKPCILVDLQHQGVQFQSGQWHDMRSVLNLFAQELALIAGRACQVAHFIRTHQFCGQCGERMLSITWEVAKQCKSCGHRAYPRLSPAVIMAIVKDGDVLLAQNKRNKGGIHSILAGFVEAGESLEQCVSREVFEEVGLKIKNIRYFGSQPWPFPHNMMIGFIADYAGGEIKLEPNELIAGGWYNASNLPEIPGPHTIAREMIDHVLELNQQTTEQIDLR